MTLERERASTRGAGPRAPDLLIMIPCFNEAGQIGRTLAELPLRVQGIGRVKVLVVDDGSVDDTATVARQAGARVLRLARHSGLAAAYRTGLAAALESGADYIVSLDGDGQYDPRGISRLLAPLCAGRADLVIGERGWRHLAESSPFRRHAHAAGAWCFRIMTGLDLEDPVTGFRAYTRQAAAQLEIRSSFTYTLELLVQAPLKGLRLEAVTIASRRTDRPSRLFRHPAVYIVRQAWTMVWAVAHYRLCAGRLPAPAAPSTPPK